MSDITFGTHTILSPIWFIIIILIIFIGIVKITMIVKNSVNNKTIKRVIFIVLFGTSISYVGITMFFVNNDYKPYAYNTTTNFATNKVLTVDDFSKIMTKEYNYAFKREIKPEGAGTYFTYTVTDLNNNKQYKNCTVDFKKINSNTVQLTDVICAKTIMKDILKNKTTK